MDYSKIEKQANRLHANAVKDGVFLHNGVRYTLKFTNGNYDVIDPDGDHIATFNTRKVTQAKKWLREYLGED